MACGERIVGERKGLSGGRSWKKGERKRLEWKTNGLHGRSKRDYVVEKKRSGSKKGIEIDIVWW